MHACMDYFKCAFLKVSAAMHYWIGSLEEKKKSRRPSAADENCLIKAFRRTKKKRRKRAETHFPVPRVLTGYALLNTIPN